MMLFGRLGRRVLAVVLALALCWSLPTAGQDNAAPDDQILATTAHRLLEDDRIVLVDIRSPFEWWRSGVPEGAIALTMHQNFETFAAGLKAASEEAGGRPIALICAAGVRSLAMQRRLAKHGFEGVINVVDGALGSPDGPGWKGSGLAMRSWP